MSDGCYFNICGDGVRTQLVWLDLCLFILIVTIVAAVGTGLFSPPIASSFLVMIFLTSLAPSRICIGVRY